MGVTTDCVNYIRDNFEKKYAENIANGVYDERDVTRLRTDFTFVRTYIRGVDRLDEGVDLVHSSLKFRKDITVNDLTESTFDLDLWNLGGMFFRNRDIEQRRILWIKVKLHRKDATPDRLQKEKEALMFAMEKAFNERPLHPIMVILDMTQCGLANMDMDFVKFVITIFKFYYPTFLGLMLIYDMPWIFNAAWKVVKAWLSAEAVARIKFVTKADIQTYIKAENIPPYMGGTDEFEYFFEPGMASLPLYPEDDDSRKKEKKVSFKEATEMNGVSAASTASSDKNAQQTDASSDELALRHGYTAIKTFTGLNKNNNANANANDKNDKKMSLVLGRSQPASGLSTFVGRLLTVSPADELTFQPNESGDAFDIITLTNTMPLKVAFKVKTTSPEKFRVRPSSGTIAPGKTEEVYVYLLQDHKADVNKDKFLIMALEVPSGSTADPNQLFREARKDTIMQHKLMCSEETKKSSKVATKVSESEESVLINKVEQLEKQTMSMRKQLNLLLTIQFLTAFTLIIVMLAYSCVGEELFTHFLALPFDFCNDPYRRKC